MALQCGFSERQAYQIASGAYAIDWDPETSPFPVGLEFSHITFGFPPDSDGDAGGNARPQQTGSGGAPAGGPVTAFPEQDGTWLGRGRMCSWRAERRPTGIGPDPD